LFLRGGSLKPQAPCHPFLGDGLSYVVQYGSFAARRVVTKSRRQENTPGRLAYT
jgi:hypothetical protein